MSTSVVRPGRWWGPPKSVVDLFLRWDTEWFLRIVREGYQYAPGRQSPVAFFPLYPLAVRGLARLGLPDGVAGIGVSNVALYAAAALAVEIWRDEYRSLRVARHGVLLIFVWPASFFHATVYSDALFLALLAGVTLASRRGRWRAAGILGFFLSLTRPIGALVLFPLLLDAWGVGIPRARRVSGAGVAWLALVPLGTLGYMAYLWRSFGDPLAFVHVLPLWGRDRAGVLTTLSRAQQYEPLYQVLFYGSCLGLLAAVVTLAAVKARPSSTVWCGLVWYTSAASGTLEAFPRLTMMALPIFGLLAALTRRRPTTYILLVAASAMLLALLTVLFANGYWMT